MTADNMTKRATGVHLRPGSSVWQWGIKAPLDLRTFYATQWAHRCSLETSDLSVANIKAAALQAEWTARFSARR